jgi:CDP-diacylglycerol--glycerol-3-phosphate 3-phosphatidyltransferase/cardiolipin synthase
MVSIILLLLRGSAFLPWVYDLGLGLLYLAALLTLWSMILYIRAAWPSLTAPPGQ